MTIQPLSDNVVATADLADEKTKSGLYLPDQSKEAPRTAHVTAIGSKVKKVKVGDRIVYKNYTHTDLKLGDKKFIIVKEEDILATVKEDKK